ncbi:14573_t:CDS:1 [Acaulospora colombiana]|uniref:14573_t:CDS:1 n=1 Tax=Acaulospora colombiana TaxID=27376 RepID=A0ACA9MCF5_9GLOM|nr:14573_t:CDS:1 [Acaulospora colombiana]
MNTRSGKLMYSILQLERLNSVGTYMIHKDSTNAPYQAYQIEGIANSKRATDITHLDISTTSLSKETYQLLRSRFISLEHLSLYESCDVFRTYGPSELDWSSFRRLISLSIAGDPGANFTFIGSIPELVRTCRSLKQLFLSDRGDEMDPADHGRSKGWSSSQHGWWNQRTPLEYFQLDVKKSATILLVGSIPVHEMRLINRDYGHFDGPFSIDPEIFPHLQILTVHSSFIRKAWGYDPDSIWTEPLCHLGEERDVDIRIEGVPLP